MPIHVPSNDVPVEDARLEDGSQFKTLAVYGNESSLMVATRPPGYHSSPHTHDCEQLNWLQAGQVWIFVEGDAHLMGAGDFLRVPAGAVHWAWNRSSEPCTLVEVHAPGIQYDGSVAGFAVGLFGDGEDPKPAGRPVNRAVPGYDQAAAESRVL